MESSRRIIRIGLARRSGGDDRAVVWLLLFYTELQYRSNADSSSSMLPRLTTPALAAYGRCGDSSEFRCENRTLSSGIFRFPESGSQYPNYFCKIWNISHEPAFADRVRLLFRYKDQCFLPPLWLSGFEEAKFERYYTVLLCRATGWRCGGCSSRAAATMWPFAAAAQGSQSIYFRSRSVRIAGLILWRSSIRNRTVSETCSNSLTRLSQSPFIRTVRSPKKVSSSRSLRLQVGLFENDSQYDYCRERKKVNIFAAPLNQSQLLIIINHYDDWWHWTWDSQWSF